MALETMLYTHVCSNRVNLWCYTHECSNGVNL
jgi:hypothetical protein